jgi:molybdopterin-guanine dinucleotide biosynthesis protein A
MAEAVTTVILAGGQGRRMGGDKGLKQLHGRPLIAWVIAALEPQGTRIVISANDNVAAYGELGYPVITDLVPGYAGPLAGVQAALQSTGSEWVASVPCDTPFLPHDLIARLLTAAAGADAAVAVVHGRRQPTVALYRKRVLSGLSRYLESGGRKVGDWLIALDAREAVFDDEQAFFNINSPDELEAANRDRP